MISSVSSARSCITRVPAFFMIEVAAEGGLPAALHQRARRSAGGAGVDGVVDPGAQVRVGVRPYLQADIFLGQRVQARGLAEHAAAARAGGPIMLQRRLAMVQPFSGPTRFFLSAIASVKKVSQKRVAGDQRDRADFDARLMHREQDEQGALVLLRRIRPQRQAPVGELRALVQVF
jgi:hypothetical protein